MRGDHSFANAILGFARSCHKRDGMYWMVHMQNLRGYLYSAGGNVFDERDIDGVIAALEIMISNAKIGKNK